MMWDLAIQLQALNVWRLKRSLSPGAVMGLHLVASNALGGSEAQGTSSSRIIRGLRSALTESSNTTKVRENGHRCLALYSNGLLAAWNASNVPLDAESFLQTAREKDGQSDLPSPAWHVAHSVVANSVWAWDTSIRKCLIVSPSGDCCVWKLTTDGGNAEMLIPAQKAFHAATSNVGKLIGVVHVPSTQLWAVALARAVVLCNEYGPVTAITGDHTSSIPVSRAPVSSITRDLSGYEAGKSQAAGKARARSASKAKEIRFSV